MTNETPKDKNERQETEVSVVCQYTRYGDGQRMVTAYFKPGQKKPYSVVPDGLIRDINERWRD